MSAHDVVIDPALRDLPPPTPHTAGVKRKGRGGANAAATSSSSNNNINNVTAAPISDRTRVTRRSAALLSAAQHLASPSDLQQRQPPDMEPTRGEEENKYQWTPRDNTSAKRSRHRSPSSHAPRSGSAAAAASGSADAVLDPALTGAASSSQHASPGLGGIDNLAAAAAVFQSNPLPYPFGLTPFRYPCLTPHLAQPPPGDPHNPDFVPFDHTEGTAVSSSTTESSTTLPPITSMSRHTSAGAGAAASGSRPGSRPPSSSGHAVDPYTSFSTLLAASEAHSTYHSPIAGSQPPSHRQTPEPRFR